MKVVPSDEELRKVAEDVRALARSLARDLWDATQSGRSSGRPATDAFRHGLQHAARGARRELRKGMQYRWHGWNPPSSPDAGRPPATAASPPPPWPPWGGYDRGPYRPRYRRRGPQPAIRHRWDASVLAAMLVVLFGAAWLVGGLGLLHLSTEAVLAAGLMLLGASLIVTGRTDWSLSRHVWPVLLGVVLVVGLFASSATFGVPGVLSHLSVGNMHSTPTGSQKVYGGFGQLTVNASQIKPGSTVEVQSIAGNTTITSLPRQQVIVLAHVLAGQVCLNGIQSNGIGASSGPVTIGSGTTQPITIDVHQLAGQVSVGPTPCGHQ